MEAVVWVGGVWSSTSIPSTCLQPKVICPHHPTLPKHVEVGRDGRKEGRREGGNEGGAYPVEGLTLNLKLRRLRLRMRRQSRAEWKLGGPTLRGGGGGRGVATLDPGSYIYIYIYY